MTTAIAGKDTVLVTKKLLGLEFFTCQNLLNFDSNCSTSARSHYVVQIYWLFSIIKQFVFLLLISSTVSFFEQNTIQYFCSLTCLTHTVHKIKCICIFKHPQKKTIKGIHLLCWFTVWLVICSIICGYQYKKVCSYNNLWDNLVELILWK